MRITGEVLSIYVKDRFGKTADKNDDENKNPKAMFCAVDITTHLNEYPECKSDNWTIGQLDN